MAQNNKKNLPNKEQLMFMLQRYTSVQLIPIDHDQAPIVISSDTANFKKPIFFNTESGKTLNKIAMALKQHAFFPPDDTTEASRILMEGNLSLINKTIAAHAKAQGDDPYNPKKVFDHHLHLMQGMNIPEYEAIEKLNELD
jgi:hypothetical protein